MQGWAALAKWSAAYLREQLGGRQVKVHLQELDAEGAPRSYGGEKRPQEIEFVEFLDCIACSPPKRRYYLLFGNIECPRTFAARVARPIFPELSPDVPVPELLPRHRLFEINLWMSYDGAITNLHFDPFDNLLCVVQGRKSLRVFAPDQTQRLHLKPVFDASNPVHSPVNALAPDLAAHPQFRGARYHTATIERGDALYMPAGYWHHVRSEGFNVAVNFWWKEERWLLHQLRSPMRRNMLWYMRDRVRSRLAAQRR